MTPEAAQTSAATAEAPARPILAFFRSDRSGRCQRVDGFLAQVLQRRRNHSAFVIKNVVQEQRPDLFERFNVEKVPTLVVIEGKRVCARLVEPRGSSEITLFLSPWLR
jgi:thioredoxin-like negative regulator of GroEL